LEKILVTSALPYANGPLHIGQIAGAYLPADIYVRFQRLIGNDVIFICGTDEFGAPISIKAEAESKKPREIVDYYHDSITKSFQGLEIDFDNFSGTAREGHIKLSQKFFSTLLRKGFISKKTTEQWYDPKYKRFLADRYVEGRCPYCDSEGARGDQCDSCGKLIDAITLKDPKSKISGVTPEIRETTHWYLNLPSFEVKLRKWLKSKTYWKDNVRNFILKWLDEGLIERAITRDTDWGVPVPLENTEGKVLYVWFDAPIGYISSTIEWAKRQGEPELWKKYWLDPETKLIHFLGKDNIPFHTIIWPAMLSEQDEGYVLPYDVPANEYLNLEGRKMSTSRNWTLWVNDYLKFFDGELLRYVIATNAPETKDSDFSWSDFQNRVNNELNNILGNLANRTFLFATRYFNGRIEKPVYLSELSEKTIKAANEVLTKVHNCYSNYQVRKSTKLIMDIARIGNRYFDESKPWVEIKENSEKASETLYVCAELLRLISIIALPIIPQSMKKLRNMMNLTPEITWSNIDKPVKKFELGKIEPLFSKITAEQIREQEERLRQQADLNGKIEHEHKEEISFGDFEKLELRLVKIINATKVKKSNKLMQLEIDLGGEKRQVVAGIAKVYKAKDLIGKKVAMVMNLKNRKIMGIESQAMILAAKNKEDMALLIPDKDLPQGSEIS